MHIQRDDPSSPQIRALLEEHLQNMRQISRPENVHALDIEGLRKPGITFWAAWSGSELLGCCALKELSAQEGEIKSMRTASGHRRKGVARALLVHVIGEARRRAYSTLSLETGSQAAFDPARRLYASFGFRPCPAFAQYADEPSSVFMTREL